MESGRPIAAQTELTARPLPNAAGSPAERRGSIWARWSLLLHRWRMSRRLLARLGSSHREARQEAQDFLLAAGEEAMPLLQRALQGPVPMACSAAQVLSRQGDSLGIRVILTRCYEEEWLYRCVEDGYLEGLGALQRLGRPVIGAALKEALETASRERELQACIAALIPAVSALRALLIFEGDSPAEWWEAGLRCGHDSLQGLAGDASALLALNLTEAARAAALRGLLCEHPGKALDILLDALRSPDLSVMLTGILGLQKLRDKRALPHLQAIAFYCGHPLSGYARRAVERLIGSNADSLTLLRAAQPDESPESLLRPASRYREEDERHLLMRPAQ